MTMQRGSHASPEGTQAPAEQQQQPGTSSERASSPGLASPGLAEGAPPLPGPRAGVRALSLPPPTRLSPVVVGLGLPGRQVRDRVQVGHADGAQQVHHQVQVGGQVDVCGGAEGRTRWIGPNDAPISSLITRRRLQPVKRVSSAGVMAGGAAGPTPGKQASAVTAPAPSRCLGGSSLFNEWLHRARPAAQLLAPHRSPSTRSAPLSERSALANTSRLQRPSARSAHVTAPRAQDAQGAG